ncbi:MAG: Mor transcription activator family protein [Methylococcaceae bacterium]|jgi:Mor family transcriptional regulator
MAGIIVEMRRVVTEVIKDEVQASAIVYALITNFGGERMYIPTNDYEYRNREIKDLHEAGASLEQLAHRFHLSVKTVYRILQV